MLRETTIEAEHCFSGAGAGGSNPLTPTIKSNTHQAQINRGASGGNHMATTTRLSKMVAAGLVAGLRQPGAKSTLFETPGFTAHLPRCLWRVRRRARSVWAGP